MLEVRNEIHVFEGMLNYIRKRFVTSLYKGSAIEVLPRSSFQIPVQNKAQLFSSVCIFSLLKEV